MGAKRNVLERGHGRDEVEALEDDAESSARRVDVRVGRGDALAGEPNRSAIDRLEKVGAAQQGRLP